MWAALLLAACQAGEIDEHVRKGFELLKVDDSRAALVAFDKALEKNPENTKALLGRGFSRLRQFKYAEAEKDLDRAVALGGRDPQIWFGRGLCREKRGAYAGARDDLDTAYRGGVRTAHVLSLKASCEVHLLDFPAAVISATRALDLNPEFAAALRTRVLAWYGRSAWGNLLKDAERLRALSPAPDATMNLVARMARLRRDGSPDGTTTPEEILKDLPDGAAKGDAAMACVLHFVRGNTHLAAGAKAKALEAFRTAAGTDAAGLAFHTLARAEVRAVGRALRRETLDRLDRAFGSIPKLEAAFTVENARRNEQGFTVTGLRIHFDRYGFKALLAIEARNDEGPVAPTYMQADSRTVRTWGPLVPEAAASDVSGVLSGAREYRDTLYRDLDAIAPRPEGSKPRPPAGTMLGLDFEPRRSENQKNSFRFSLGQGTRSASWFGMLDAVDDARLREEGGAAWFDLPSRNVRIALDPETGMLRGFEAREFDGRVVKVTMTSFSRETEFPDIPPPDDLKTGAMDPAAFIAQMAQDAAILPLLLSEAFDRWDAIREAKGGDRLARLLTRAAATILDRYYAYALDGFARSYVAADPKPTREKFRKAFAAHEKKFRDHLLRIQGDLAAQTWERTVSGGLDVALHPALKALMEKSMGFDAVDGARRKAHGDRLDEALERALGR